jgi:putative ABC transport system permease protein
MLRNYLKIAFRNLWKHKVFSFINIMGLTVGLTAGFLIFLYVRFELSYDTAYDNNDRIYRLSTDLKTPTETIKTGASSWAFGPNIQLDFPEVDAFVRIYVDGMLVRKGEKKIQEDKVIYADSAFFETFGNRLVQGNPHTALKAPFNIVLSETAAKKYFGKEEPMGQTLLLTGDGTPATVTGVMKDLPENSTLNGDMMVSMSTITEKYASGIDKQWGNFGAATYLLLKPGANVAAIEARFPAFLEKRNGENMKKSKMFYTFHLEPLKSIYLHSDRDGGGGGSMTNVYIFSMVAVFILLIACINFINLTTARSAERAKEVGIRKVVGALKMQLTRQFIGESIILCAIAFLLTLGLSILLLPLFNQLSGKTISHGIFNNLPYLGLLLGTALLISLLAGFYPALVLSSFKPIVVLKGRFSTGTRGILLRKGLVVAQFSISIALIISTIVVYKQMSFMRQHDLGFNKEQVMVFNTDNDPAKESFKQAIAGISSIQSTALSSSVPGSGNPGAYSEIENMHGDLQVANLDLYYVDFDYIKQFGIKVVAGRAFSQSFGTDTTKALILNEAAVKMFGYTSPQQAIGKRFKQWGREGQIVGVIKNFNYRSLQSEVKPLTMRIDPRGSNLISARIAAANVPATLKAVEEKWKAFFPNRPFSYYFLDEFFDRQYRAEERFGKLFFNFAILAIFISCLGLLGLAAYSTMQRTKEIGIRKVMGASVSGIVNLLSKDFLLLVIISFFIAAPTAWYFMNQWVEGFAYRTPISWWVFAAAGIAALLIALGTISFQAIKAAVMNPVKSLRSE